MESKKRLKYVDAEKGIGIIAVMLGHSCGLPETSHIGVRQEG